MLRSESERMFDLKYTTHLRVYNVLNDSKNGWSSAGVADSAVVMNSSRTSLGGAGSDIMMLYDQEDGGSVR